MSSSLGALASERRSAARDSAQPRLLISVRDNSEVDAALAGGADWIDLKEPAKGSLGAVGVDVARRAVRAVAGRRPVSAALGELIDWPSAASRKLLEVPEVAVVKLGLAACGADSDWFARWREAAQVVGRAGKDLAAVVYADWQQAGAPSPWAVLGHARDCGCHYVLIDTFDKRAGSVSAQLATIHPSARRVGLPTVVAGGLARADVAQLPVEGVDLVAVRGGVCRGGREGTVDAELVRDFRRAIASRWVANSDRDRSRLPERPESA